MKGRLIGFGIAILSAIPGMTARADYTYITNFAKTADLQVGIEPSYPTGIFSPNNGFGASFDITSDANGNNYAELRGTNGQLYSAGSYTVNVGIYGVTDVYTLMNAYYPLSGQVLASVEFFGSGGATQTFQLVNGVNVRDEFMGGYANTINGTTTRNAFTVTGQGGAGTGNPVTGAYGTYVIDEQQFALSSAFATQTLTQITYTYSGSSGTAILEGLTVQSTPQAAVPEPSSLLMLGIGVVGIASCRYRRGRRSTTMT